MSLPPPSDEVARLANVVGPEGALALVEAHGGTRLYVPKTPTPQITDLVGAEASAALSAAAGGEYIKVPLARAWRVEIYRRRRMSHAAIARRLGVAESTISRILKDRGLTRPQLDLFG